MYFRSFCIDVLSLLFFIPPLFVICSCFKIVLALFQNHLWKRYTFWSPLPALRNHSRRNCSTIFSLFWLFLEEEDVIIIFVHIFMLLWSQINLCILEIQSVCLWFKGRLSLHINWKKNNPESTLTRKEQWKSTVYEQETETAGRTSNLRLLRSCQRKMRGSLELRGNSWSPERTGFELQLSYRWRRNYPSQKKSTEGKSLKEQIRKHNSRSMWWEDEQGAGTGLGIENEGNYRLYLMLTQSSSSTKTWWRLLNRKGTKHRQVTSVQ